jgi:hypothetical protein
MLLMIDNRQVRRGAEMRRPRRNHNAKLNSKVVLTTLVELWLHSVALREWGYALDGAGVDRRHNGCMLGAELAYHRKCSE